METAFGALEALQLVSAFFPEEWSKSTLEDVQLRRVTGGLINRLHLLTRRTAIAEEPGAVLIRHFGIEGDRQQQPFVSRTTLSSTEQAIVYMEMARRGWGPKIYGTFLGGRLEQWIDAHPLTAEESTDASIRCDVARSFARLHSLQLPFRKDNFQLVVDELDRAAKSKSSEVIDFLLGLEHPEATKCATTFRDTDWSHELAWASSLLRKHNCKTAFTLGDTNYLNILVKNYESQCRAMLIDYETVTYSYRGIDIGGHFMERMYSWGEPTSKLTGYDVPNIEEQRAFCEVYLQEMRNLGQAMSAIDTVDHLMLEAQIGQLYQLLIVILMCLVMDETEGDPLFLAGLNHMMEYYRHSKVKYLSKRVSAE